MHWQKASAPEPPPPQPSPRPYQGVRVKEPVKELLKRKRGSLQNANGATAAATTVFFPHQSLPSYSPAGQVCADSEFVASPLVDDGTLYSGWLAQPSPATLQPLTQWAAYPDYVPHEAVSCPYTGEMYVQPVCPSYTLVGTSSVLTYASQPLITNLAARSTSAPAVMPHLDMMEQQGPLSYFPWTQPISTLPAPSLQYQAASSALPAPQFLPLPVSVPETVSQDLEDTRKDLGGLSMEKLLLQEENHGIFDLSNSLPVEGL
ncbi:POU domain class 2-associating factor 1 [Anolis carolinensis]|uniref:POU class 2 homeobox associating factor 1 n=1 Tax=Anolis carolinensis TaxID=28377 RepID=H9GBP6_ANOCA|nr:PREDICTED: POU domain class 2-associating factor 1 [Anolis carolinensis]|eukprot:XP_008119288.1 PREDICTED: POU domain class 2-associating factor 1 [Anolis carolinensis]